MLKDTVNGMDDQCKILKKAPVGNTDRCLEQLFFEKSYKKTILSFIDVFYFSI
jgi:hypothetical protein